MSEYFDNRLRPAFEFIPATVLLIVGAVLMNDAAGVFRVIDSVIETGLDPRRFVEDLLERFRDLIVVAAAPEPSASTSGLPEPFIASAPPAPVTSSSIAAALTSSSAIAAMIPRGTLRSGSAASSAASGTPSMARKNQIA